MAVFDVIQAVTLPLSPADLTRALGLQADFSAPTLHTQLSDGALL
jgi:hypothetical protein